MVLESPDWVHLANYRRSNTSLFSAATRDWIQTVQPPPFDQAQPAAERPEVGVAAALTA